MSAHPLLLTLKNDLAELARIAEEIESHGVSRRWPARWIMNLNLSLDELITNTVSYGYQDTDEHEIRVMLTERNGALVTVVEDDGVAFDPFTVAPTPDLEADVEERPIGGLGVYFVKTLMDEVAYERVGDRNRITLVQRTPE